MAHVLGAVVQKRPCLHSTGVLVHEERLQTNRAASKYPPGDSRYWGVRCSEVKQSDVLGVIGWLLRKEWPRRAHLRRWYLDWALNDWKDLAMTRCKGLGLRVEGAARTKGPAWEIMPWYIPKQAPSWTSHSSDSNRQRPNKHISKLLVDYDKGYEVNRRGHVKEWAGGTVGRVTGKDLLEEMRIWALGWHSGYQVQRIKTNSRCF